MFALSEYVGSSENEGVSRTLFSYVAPRLISFEVPHTMEQVMKMPGQCFTAFLFGCLLSGCATGPVSFMDAENCGPEPGSSDWWAEKALLPPGARQRCHKGKMWPPQPRPTVEAQQFSHAYHSEHYWPLPYVCQDRAYVRDIVAAQDLNGWQQQSTLYTRHFDEDQQLTSPGRFQLMDILEVNPLQYRSVYIQSTFNPEFDNVRLANVQQVLAEITGGAEDISVSIRRGRDYSRPASEVKVINDLYHDSVPAPRLASQTGGGGAGGGGAGGGGPALGGP